MNRRVLVLLFVLAAAVVLAFLFRDRLDALSQGEIANVVYLLLALVLVGGGMWAGARGPSGGKALRDLALWALILFGAMGAYFVKDDLGAMLNPSAPRSVEMAAERTGVELRRAEDGHFYADVALDGVTLRMMVDTGATVISLSRNDAARIGMDVSDLRFDTTVSTAGGEMPAAPTYVRSVRLGSIEVGDVRALVMGSDTRESVLGLSFLDKLDGYEVRGDRLILYPKR